MRSSKARKIRSRRDGCGFLTLTCLFTCFFLILNSAVVSRFYPQFSALWPSLLRQPRVVQMMMFVAPVVLIFFEWWLVDLAADFLSPAGQVRHGDQQRDRERDSKVP
ncbi:MAG: hypothetical protein JJ992_29765 [Planctomycetes bacterium]|nr:hypothetical protein [Planctomycetota bacterium]